MMLDDKGRQIAYQVAWKGAIDLIAAVKAIVDPTKPVGTEVKELADSLYAALLEGLDPHGVVSGAPLPSPAPHEPGQPPVLLTGTACPECEQNGRNGVLLQNTDPAFTGPEFSCSLRKPRKVGTKWVETGPCAYVNWGR